MRRFCTDEKLTRSNNIDFLRVVLATSVIFSHSFQAVRGWKDLDPLSRLSRNQLSFGALAVNFFFTLSGFLIAQSWLKAPRLGTFFRKRFLRIHPAYVVAMFFCAMVVVPLSAGSARLAFQPRQLLKTAGDSAILHRFETTTKVFTSNPMGGAIDPPMWTIQHEVWCYVLLALIGVSGMLRGRTVVCLFFGAFVLFQLSQMGHFVEWPKGIRYFFGSLEDWPRFITYFLAGTLFFLLRTYIPFSPGLAVLALAIALVGCRFRHGMDLLMPFAGTYLIFFIAFNPQLPFANFGKRGDFSYGIYLYAFPVQQLLVQWTGNRLGVMAHFAAATCVTVVLAFLSWHLVEKHFLRMKPRSTPAASAVPTATDPLIDTETAPVQLAASSS